MFGKIVKFDDWIVKKVKIGDRTYIVWAIAV